MRKKKELTIKDIILQLHAFNSSLKIESCEIHIKRDTQKAILTLRTAKDENVPFQYIETFF